MPRSQAGVTIPRAQERLVIARMLIELVRGCKNIDGLSELDIESLLVMAAVFVGEVEHRPLGASKISDYVGLPRETVRRKIKALAEVGQIKRHGNAYCYTDAARERVDHVGLIAKIIQNAAAALLNLGTMTLSQNREHP